MKNLTTNEKIAVAVGIVVVGFFFIFGNILINIFTTGRLTNSTVGQTQNTQTDMQTDTQTATSTTVGGSPAPLGTPGQTGQLGITDTVVGTGAVAQPGDTVTVNYVGTLQDGTVFDSSVARNQPFSFTLGTGQVIPGWDQGIVGMKVGGTRVLTIPPNLGYGSQAYGPIPAGSTLVFQVELLKVTQ